MYEIFDELCKERNMTPYRVAKECGFSGVSLSDWKSGKSHPNVDKLIKIARCLNTTVEYLVTGENSVPLPRLPLDEEALLSDFRRLNQLGREKAADYISDLADNEKYIKDTPGMSMIVG